MKRILSWILAVALLCGVLPLGAVSAEETEIAYPVEGGNIYFDPATGTITDIDATVTEAVIPEQIEGVTVTAVRAGAFSDFGNYGMALKRVVLPETVTEIGSEAFYLCKTLEEVNIPSGVEVLPMSCFYCCESLTKVHLSEGLKTIEDWAFMQCTSLAEINLPEGLETLEGNVFQDCAALTELSLPESVNSVHGDILYGTPILDDESNWTGDCLYLDNWLISTKEEMTATELQVREGTIGIAGSVGANTALEKVELPEGLKYISNGAFMGCTGIKEIVFPESLEKIESTAFAFGNAAIRVFFKGDVPEISGQAFYVFVESLMGYGISPYMCMYYIEGKEGWASPTWNGYPTDIWDGVHTYPVEITYPVMGGEIYFNPQTGLIFTSTYDIIEAKLPEGIDIYEVTGIGDNAFYDRKSLHCVEIPAYVREIGDLAFRCCEQLEQVRFLGDAPETFGEDVFADVGENFTIYYPEGAAGWTSPTWNGYPAQPWNGESSHSVTVKVEDATCLEDGVAKYTCVCGYSAEITIEAYGHSYGDDGCIRCGVMPNGTCGDAMEWTFDMREGILTISGSGKMYDYDYFDGTPWTEYKDRVEEVRFEGEITHVGENAFKDCDVLSKVSLPQSLKSIGESAFWYCTALEELILPEGLETIGYGAFSYSGLRQAVIPASATNLDEALFFGCAALRSLTIEAEVTSIGWMFCTYCSSLEEVNLPDSLTQIGMQAFLGCGSLEEIKLPAKLEIIDREAFKDCISLTKVTIPAGVKNIGVCAFLTCKKLTEVYFLGDAPKVGNNAFCIWSNDVGLNVSIPGMVLYYLEGKAGWTSPEWNGYPTAIWEQSHEHDYVAVVTAPTCTEEGYTTYTCACGDSYVADKVAALGHSHTAVVTAPTCTEEGYTTYTCACGDSYVADKVAALGHSHTAVVTAPTCTEDGYTTYTCACGDSYVADEVTALGHDYQEGKCTRCGEADPDYKPVLPPVQFKDVAENAWYKGAVDYAVTNGLMNGVGDGKFEPESPMTRAMLVMVLWRYAGEPAEGKNEFSDVAEDAWYAEAVAWAAENGVVTGVGNGKFDPDGKITREQMATILYRYSKAQGIDVSKRAELTAFPDGTKVSGYAAEALSWAVAEGLINGSDGKLLPQGNATRAQVATILMRYIETVME